MLQRKQEEWRRLHATPSVFASASAGVTSAPAQTTTSSSTAGPAAPGGKERKKRKRGVSMVEDEIDALFDGALGCKVARSALSVGDSGAAAPEREQEDREDRNAGCGLGAVVDAIRAVPKGGEGKKKRVRRPG